MIAAELSDSLTWLGWAIVAGSAFILLTQFAHWSRLRVVGILQSTNVPGTALLALTAFVAVVAGRYLLAVAALSVGAVAAATVVRALRATVGPGRFDEPALTVRIVSSNILYENDDIVDAADILHSVDADVVFICEYNAAFHEALTEHPLRVERPHRLEDPREKGAGSVIWSRLPIIDADPARDGRDTVTATVDGPFGPVSVLAVHPNTPVHDVRLWRSGLRLIRERAARIHRPLLVIGDFNATYWHPLYADLRSAGLIDEHIELGQGWSVSWPTHELVPPWVRLDHVLTSNGLRAANLENLDVPGTDHAATVVDVALVQPD